MLLAGDIGGTKTLLGLFTPKPDRPSAIDVGEFVTLDYQGLEPMIEAFLESRDVEPRHIEAACFGVAGAVTDQIARMTNVPWLVDATAIDERLKFRRTHVLNDLETLAYGVTVLEADELTMLQRGVPHANGNAAVIAAGPGLGKGSFSMSTADSFRVLRKEGMRTLRHERRGRSTCCASSPESMAASVMRRSCRARGW